MRDIAARTLEVHSTPSFFVNDQRMSGEHGLDAFEKILAPLTH
jgi:hypothetical protein